MYLAVGEEEEAYKVPLQDLLVDKGVDINARRSTLKGCGDQGYTALHFSMRYICSRRYNFFDPTSLDFSYRIVAYLLYLGANPHIVDAHGHTPTAMVLAGGTIAFKFWQHSVKATKDVQEFIRKELQNPSSLHDDGWDEISLLQMFSCNFETSG